MVKSLETDIDYAQQHTEILREAKKWEHNQRNDSFLLQGEELAGAEKWLEEAEQRLKASESVLETERKKDPNPLLTEQQRNFIRKSRENEDANNRAEIVTQELSAKSQELENVGKKRKEVEAKAKQAENKLVLVGKNLKLAQGKLTLAQQQQQQAR